MKSKTNKKSNKKSKFIKHEALIVQGRLMELEGWLEAGRECLAEFGGNASAYARASQTQSHSTATIRQYVGVALKAMKKWGKKTEDIRQSFEFGVGYAYTNMDDLRSFLNTGTTKKKSTRFSAKREAEKFTKRGLTKAQVLEIAKYMK